MKTPIEPKKIDAGIASYVFTLRRGGVETFESCQGGKGHAFHEPTIRFHGSKSEGMRAVSLALQNGIPVANLRRVWDLNDGELTGPYWEMTFVGKVG